MRQIDPSALFDEGGGRRNVVGDRAREAVASLRGYAYQAYAAALEWMALPPGSELHLEVAEDFAVAAEDSLRAVQVKDRSEAITLGSRVAVETIDALVRLTDLNPDRTVRVALLTTASIGLERSTQGRPGGIAGIEYWRAVADGADPSELRRVLLDLGLAENTKAFIRAREDEELRTELVQRLDWFCGSAPLAEMRQRLRQRARDLCADSFRLPLAEGDRLVPHILVRVLETSCSRADRVLRQIDLRDLVDAATRISVPASYLEAVMLREAAARAADQAPTETDPTVPEAGLPLPSPLAERLALVAAVQSVVTEFDGAVIVGGSGMGKTSLARQAARRLGGEWRILDLRGVASAEAATRLMEAARLIGDRTAGLIADDVPDLDVPDVASRVGRAWRELRDRKKVLLLISDRAPGAARRALGAERRGILEAPSLTQEEVDALVRGSGGGEDWAVLIFAASRGGHPQLAHALVTGLAERGWPVGEANIRSLMESEELADQDLAARRALARAVPDEGARALLHRLSLVADRFPRRVAIAVGAVPPPSRLPGENFDRLLGPWIDQVGEDRFRVSPLLLGAGLSTLSVPERMGVDRATAEALVVDRLLAPDQAANIYFHSLRAGLTRVLKGFAGSLLKAGPRELNVLRRYLPQLVLSPADRPILPQDPEVSLMLRFAQFELAASSTIDEVTAVAASGLFAEVERSTHVRRIAGLAKIFSVRGLAAYLTDWPEMLASLAEAAIDAPSDVSALFATAPENAKLVPTLFGCAVLDVADVASLATAFDRLDRLAPAIREALMEVGDGVAAPQHLVARTWLREQERGSLDPLKASATFRRMAHLAAKWHQLDWAIGLRVAAAHVLAEPGRDEGAALAELEEAVVDLGERTRLLRARAHILYVQKEDEAVTGIVERLSGEFQDDPLERAYLLREGAVSAGRLGRHPRSMEWFSEAFRTLDGMRWRGATPMMVGLRADAASASWRADDRPEALRMLAFALEGLADVDAGASLQAGYVHRVVRHALLWFLKEAGEREVEVDGMPPQLPPGTCSNPNPFASVLELDLAPLDLAWYVLAQIGFLAGLPGHVPDPASRILGQPIPAMEATIRKYRVDHAIVLGDVGSFMASLRPWLEAAVALPRMRAQAEAILPANWVRGEIGPVEPGEEASAANRAEDAALAFGIVSADRGAAALIALQEAMAAAEIPLIAARGGVAEAFKALHVGRPGRWTTAECAAAMTSPALDPERLLEVTLRVLLHLRGNDYGRVAVAPFVRWAKARWAQAATEQRFALRAPSLTASPILHAATSAGERLEDVAALALVALPAVQLQVSAEVVAEVRQMLAR